MKESTMFLNRITTIDYAILAEDGIKGGSYNVNVEVTGKVDEEEQVVVDFSSIKSLLKQLIDDKITGFDHKLWVVTTAGKPNKDAWGRDIKETEIGYEISPLISPLAAEDSTECGSLKVPHDGVRFIASYFRISDQISRYLEDFVNATLSTNNIRIKVRLDQEENISEYFRESSLIMPFNYVHGLKNSTSWGCQNIVHGHSSFVAIPYRRGESVGVQRPPRHNGYTYSDVSNGQQDQQYTFESNFDCEFLRTLLVPVIDKIDNAILIWYQNIIRENAREICFGYCTGRGMWEMTIPKSIKHLVLNTETTVENLADWFEAELLSSNHIRNILYDKGIRKVFVSEGLSKGACFTLDR